MKEAHVTLYDVADRAGVSASTASRALAGLKVSKANLVSVEKAAAELGYVPNEAARSLRAVRTMTVGMVFHQLTSSLGIELLGSLSAALDKMGYSLFVSTAQTDDERYEQLVRRFLERRVDALVCVHGQGEGRSLDRFRAAGIPALSLVAHSGGYASLPLVTDSIHVAARACVDDLLAKGHRRIGIVKPLRPVHLVADVIGAAGEHGITLTAPRDRSGKIDAAVFLDQVAAMDDPPTALVAFYGEVVEILDAADARGLAVPDQLSLVAMRDRSPLNLFVRLPISTLHIDPGHVGIAAGEVLAAWLETGTAPSKDVLVEAGVWLDRGSTGPGPAA